MQDPQLLMPESDPKKFRSISPKLAILQNNLQNAEKIWSVKSRTAPKMRIRSCNFTKFTKAMSCHQYLDTDHVSGNRHFIRAKPERKSCKSFGKSGLRCINFWLNGYYEEKPFIASEHL